MPHNYTSHTQFLSFGKKQQNRRNESESKKRPHIFTEDTDQRQSVLCTNETKEQQGTALKFGVDVSVHKSMRCEFQNSETSKNSCIVMTGKYFLVRSES